jgi:hypothetical protein
MEQRIHRIVTYTFLKHCLSFLDWVSSLQDPISNAFWDLVDLLPILGVIALTIFLIYCLWKTARICWLAAFDSTIFCGQYLYYRYSLGRVEAEEPIYTLVPNSAYYKGGDKIYHATLGGSNTIRVRMSESFVVSTKVLESATQIGKTREMNIAGNHPSPVKDGKTTCVDGIVSIYTEREEGGRDVLGMGFRAIVGTETYLAITYHQFFQIKYSEVPHFLEHRGRNVPFLMKDADVYEFSDQEKGFDYALLSLPKPLWSVLGVKAIKPSPKIGHLDRSGVKVFGWTESNRFCSSIDILKGGGQLFEVEYRATTIPSWSGSPLLDQNNKYLGIHLGANTTKGCNFGSLAVWTLVDKTRESSTTTTDDKAWREDQDLIDPDFIYEITRGNQSIEVGSRAQYYRFKTRDMDELMTGDEIYGLEPSDWAHSSHNPGNPNTHLKYRESRKPSRSIRFATEQKSDDITNNADFVPLEIPEVAVTTQICVKSTETRAEALSNPVPSLVKPLTVTVGEPIPPLPQETIQFPVKEPTKIREATIVSTSEVSLSMENAPPEELSICSDTSSGKAQGSEEFRQSSEPSAPLSTISGQMVKQHKAVLHQLAVLTRRLEVLERPRSHHSSPKSLRRSPQSPSGRSPLLGLRTSSRASSPIQNDTKQPQSPPIGWSRSRKRHYNRVTRDPAHLPLWRTASPEQRKHFVDFVSAWSTSQNAKSTEIPHLDILWPHLAPQMGSS